MSRNNYLTEVDKALVSLAKKKHEDRFPNRIPYSKENVQKGLIRKEAFDVYKVDNDPYEGLWILQDADDGKHLVRASNPQFGRKEHGDWTAISDYNRENVTLAYKNVPIARFSSKEFGFEPEDVMTFKSALLDRVDNDQTFIKDVLSGQPNGKREALATTFPEFKKFI